MGREVELVRTFFEQRVSFLQFFADVFYGRPVIVVSVECNSVRLSGPSA